MLVIALSGMPGSGKSVFAHHASLLGLPVYRLGATVVSEVTARSLPVTAENEEAVRMELREKHGSAFMAVGAIEWATRQDASVPIVLDGLYTLDEYELLSAEYGSSLHTVAVLADRRVRHDRLAVRSERPLSADESRRRDVHEVKNLRKAESIALADHFTLNNGELMHALGDFVRWLDETVQGADFVDPSETLAQPAPSIHRALADDTFRALTPWDNSLLVHRAVTERNPLLTWYTCKLIGERSVERGLNFLCWVGTQPDVDFDTTSLHRVAAWALGELGSEAGPILRDRLDHGSTMERRFAADALGQVRDSSAIRPLVQHLREDDLEVARWAALSLTKIPDDRVVDELERALVSVTEQKRRYIVVDALAHVDISRARNALRKLSGMLGQEDMGYLEGAARQHRQQSRDTAPQSAD